MRRSPASTTTSARVASSARWSVPPTRSRWWPTMRERSASKPEILTGGQAVAEAMRQIDPDVVPVYPITPQTPIIQGYSAFVAAGRAHGELVNVESEHSAMSAAIGAAL